MEQRDRNNTARLFGGFTSPTVLPGHSDGPRSSPRRLNSIMALVRDNLDRTDETGSELNSEVIAKSLIRLAKQGNVQAIQLILQGTED